ncbi:MAG TPA: 6,7-dimethyl-8-ribityllumazine synthase [Steroidobacteraceae bacterium]|nr:6,7-dimethyl-8-ribityllumazine synthase [Steroidobacteraceae bacterium]
MSGSRPADAEVSARGRRVALVAARFNDLIVDALVQGASATWLERGGAADDLAIVRVPGAFELPLAAARLAGSGRYEAVVALGCVIRGDTPHFEYVAGECARGLQQAALDTGVPIAFGVLTVETLEQARTRAAPGAGNKGAEAMDAALEMAALLKRI